MLLQKEVGGRPWLVRTAQAPTGEKRRHPGGLSSREGVDGTLVDDIVIGSGRRQRVIRATGKEMP